MRLVLGAALAAMAISTPASAAEFQDAIRSDMPQLMSLYRELHAHPELSNREERTARVVAEHLRALGLEPTVEVGGGHPPQVRHPVTYSVSTPVPPTAPPALGEHDDEIRRWLADDT